MDVFEDLKQAGVIDLIKVMCIVLENVVFILGMLLMIECVINDKLELEGVGVGMLGGGMLGGMLGMM